MKAYFLLMFTCKGICKNTDLGYAEVSNKYSVNVFSVEHSLFFVEIPILSIFPWIVVSLKVTETC